MDPKIREHAEVLVDWSARIDAGDDVVVSVAEGAHELAVAVAEKLGDRGANVVTTYASDEVSRAYLRAHDGEFETAGHELALYENADSVLFLGGGRNTFATADVPGETRQAAARAAESVREARMNTDWVSTVHPTRSLAQQAGMSYEEYREFVYDAVLRDWEALAEEMAEMKEVLDEGSEVRLVKEETTERDGSTGPSRTTDLTMSIEGRTAVNSAASVAYDSHNLPSGEVFTAPYDPEGEAFFDVPMTINGTRVRDVRLTFEDGEVTDFAAESGEAALGDVLDTDEGARRLGELGIGMNRGIDRFTDSILFDEKMGDTVHLAVGRAYDACLPEGEAGNDSAVHVDMITDVSEDSRIEVDGEVVQRDGVFRWEQGFER
ncbi:aminopeptidase [Halogeometricum sp. S1BR25-6]|uniref:Aminopeptidase n=1 Tax=Halogeometricum salsisoli TaxID=2950536 RepID=A0ABU2GGU6_9EURY|nr:aminopeptidase [Halogeometricum sp. S1BR25-6]MDS0300031.1 aminopeptidase [Halogeometricum sp. S1BR25-6]